MQIMKSRPRSTLSVDSGPSRFKEERWALIDGLELRDNMSASLSARHLASSLLELKHDPQ